MGSLSISKEVIEVFLLMARWSEHSEHVSWVFSSNWLNGKNFQLMFLWLQDHIIVTRDPQIHLSSGPPGLWGIDSLHASGLLDEEGLFWLQMFQLHVGECCVFVKAYYFWRCLQFKVFDHVYCMAHRCSFNGQLNVYIIYWYQRL